MTAPTKASRLPASAQPKEMLDLTRLAVPVAISRASFMLMSLTDAIVLSRSAPGELPLRPQRMAAQRRVHGLQPGSCPRRLRRDRGAERAGQGERDRPRLPARARCSPCSIRSSPPPSSISRPSWSSRCSTSTSGAGRGATAETTRILAIGIIGHMVGTTCSFYSGSAAQAEHRHSPSRCPRSS